MCDGPLIGSNHVHAPCDGGADVSGRRLARRRVERCQLHRHLRTGGLKELFDRCRPYTEVRSVRDTLREAARVHCSSVPQSVDSRNGEWEFAALLPQQAHQSTPYVTVSDNGQFQCSIVSKCAKR